PPKGPWRLLYRHTEIRISKKASCFMNRSYHKALKKIKNRHKFIITWEMHILETINWQKRSCTMRELSCLIRVMVIYGTTCVLPETERKTVSTQPVIFSLHSGFSPLETASVPMCGQQ